MHMGFMPAMTEYCMSDSVSHQSQYKTQYTKHLLKGTGEQPIQAESDAASIPKRKETSWTHLLWLFLLMICINSQHRGIVSTSPNGLRGQRLQSEEIKTTRIWGQHKSRRRRPHGSGPQNSNLPWRSLPTINGANIEISKTSRQQ